jgi:hypothetical protein
LMSMYSTDRAKEWASGRNSRQISPSPTNPS